MSVCIQHPARSKLWAPYRMDACSVSYISKVIKYLALSALPNPQPFICSMSANIYIDDVIYRKVKHTLFEQ